MFDTIDSLAALENALAKIRQEYEDLHLEYMQAWGKYESSPDQNMWPVLHFFHWKARDFHRAAVFAARARDIQEWFKYDGPMDMWEFMKLEIMTRHLSPTVNTTSGSTLYSSNDEDVYSQEFWRDLVKRIYEWPTRQKLNEMSK